MKKLLMVALLFVAILGTITGPVAAQTSLADVTLFADNLNINVGNLTAMVDGDSLTMTYDTVDGWVMNETHVYVGSTAPAKSSPGKFPFKHENLNGVASDTDTVSLSSLGLASGSTVFVAVQAALQKAVLDEAGNPVLDDMGNPVFTTESAWAKGDPIPPGKNWAMFFTVTIP